MNDEERALRRLHTRSMAVAFADDTAHIRRTLADEELTAGDVRRLSIIVRRLLVDDELTRVAAPRVGRIHILAQDNNPAYRALANKGDLCAAFVSGGPPLCGLQIRWFRVAFDEPLTISGDPDAMVELTVDSFLKQRVIFSYGKWLNRRQVIKFVANKGSGAHSGRPVSEDELLAAQLQTGLFLGIRPSTEASGAPTPNDPNNLDGVTYELLCSAYFLAHSPDVIDLERRVAAELANCDERRAPGSGLPVPPS